MKNFDRDDANTNLGKPYLADYFSLEVEVLIWLPGSSLVRYGGREFVVLSQDLQSMRLHCRSVAAATHAPCSGSKSNATMDRYHKVVARLWPVTIPLS